VKRVVVVVVFAVLAGAAAGAARATNECRGLQVCVPVAGPWVVASPAAEVQFQLACPARFVVGGLDAELSRRGIDVAFRGAVGSPVNPGITTSTSAVFMARILAGRTGATFRPHIGCVPASGGGQRFPTAYHVVPPAKPLAPTIFDLPVVPGVHALPLACRAGRELVGATHAIGFFTDAPPAAALAQSIRVKQTIHGGIVRVVIRAGKLEGVRAVVQVDLVCV
jgi:hypothetical protein